MVLCETCMLSEKVTRLYKCLFHKRTKRKERRKKKGKKTKKKKKRKKRGGSLCLMRNICTAFQTFPTHVNSSKNYSMLKLLNIQFVYDRRNDTRTVKAVLHGKKFHRRKMILIKISKQWYIFCCHLQVVEMLWISWMPVINQHTEADCSVHFRKAF